MATVGNTYIQLIDAMKADNMSGAVVVNQLRKLNPVMKDANVITANNGTSHTHLTLTGLPSVAWGALYEGIPQSKAGFQEVQDTTGFLEGRSSIDTRLLAISKDPAAVRMMYATPHLESMAQEFESTFFYSDVAVNGRKFHGLAPRYSSLTGAKSSSQVIDGGGVGSDNTSFWFVTHGDHATSIITPAGMTAGVMRDDKGEQRELDENGNAYYVKEELFTQHAGVAVSDWRYNARVANVDVSEMQAGNLDINGLLRQAYYRLKGRRAYDMSTGDDQFDMGSTGRTVLYMNSAGIEALDAESTATGSAVRLRPMEIQGEEILTWRGIPIREADAILNTEAAVV